MSMMRKQTVKTNVPRPMATVEILIIGGGVIGSSIDYLADVPTPELDQLTPDRIAHFAPAQVAAFLTETPSVNGPE